MCAGLSLGQDMIWMGNLLMSIDKRLRVMQPFSLRARKRAGAQNQSGDLTDVIQSMGYSERLQDSKTPKTPTQAKVLAKLQVKLQAEAQIKNAFACLTVPRVSRVPQGSWPHSSILSLSFASYIK